MKARALRVTTLAMLVLAGLGCSDTRDPSAERVLGSTSDGTAVFAAVADSETSTRILRLDADADQTWEHTIGRSYGQLAVDDGYVWIVEAEPEGSPTTDVDSPDLLLKLDAQTGELIGSTAAGADIYDTPLMIDDEIWLLDLTGIEFLVIDPDQLQVVDRVDLRPDESITALTTGEFEPLVYGPIRHGGRIYAIGTHPASVIGVSIDRRELDAVLPVRLRIRTRLEAHDDTIWVPQSVGTMTDGTGWLAHPLDPETFELGEPVPYFESPMRSLVTEQFVFDQTGPDEITQIDRSTGQVVRTIEGRDPRFLLEDRLWLGDLRRVDLE